MQLSYIKSLAQAYVIDNKLYEGTNIITEDELAENFYNAIKILRSDHLTLYESFLQSNKFEQQKIFKTYFDLCFEKDESLESLDEGFMSSLGAILGSLRIFGLVIVLIALFSGRISRGIWKVIVNITTTLGNIGKWFSKIGDSGRISYSVLLNNSQKCLTKCNYNPKKAKLNHLLYQMRQGSTFRDIGKMLVGLESEEKLKCMRECYLDHIREVVKLAANMYFQCLRNTGDSSRLPLERDFSAFQKIVIKTKLNESCESFMKPLSQSLKIFDNTISLIYHEERSKRVRQRVELMNEIYKIQKKNQSSPRDRKSSQNNYSKR